MGGTGGFIRRCVRLGEDDLDGEHWRLVAEKSGMLGQVESIGILCCAQDDSENCLA